MAAKKTAKRAPAPDRAQPYDPNLPCPACNSHVHMYIPPERSVGGPSAYPALLLHYEAKHPDAMPPPPPAPGVDKDGKERPADVWEPMPPAPADWLPVDLERAKRQLRQEDGVWPPVRMPEMPI